MKRQREESERSGALGPHAIKGEHRTQKRAFPRVSRHFKILAEVTINFHYLIRTGWSKHKYTYLLIFKLKAYFNYVKVTCFNYDYHNTGSFL